MDEEEVKGKMQRKEMQDNTRKEAIGVVGFRCEDFGPGCE